MKAKYEKELNRVNLQIETHQFYEEDYQMRMLRENEIAGLAKVECQHINGESLFNYDVSNMMSLRKKHEMMELRCEDIYHLVEVIIETVEEMQSYFLSADRLVLDPSLIYWNKEKWSFIYLPVKKSNLNKAFHELTEYFVKTLDYKEMEGIQLASFLHKETLQENFNLKEIIDRYEEIYKKKREIEELTEEEGEEEKEGEELTRNFLTEEDEYIGINIEDYQAVRESPGKFQLYGEDKNENQKNEKTKKKANKILFRKDKEGATPKFRKSRWGEWEDLITD